METKVKIVWSGFQSLNQVEVSKVPTSSGVYLLWVKLNDGKWSCFYVGQSGDLRRRLNEHLSSSEENGCMRGHVSKHVCGFEFALVQNQVDRDRIEKFLYDIYDPECNEVDPGGIALPVNLP